MKISPEQIVTRRQELRCKDTIKASVVSIYLLENKTGKIIRCGSGCVVDSARGLIITGGHILRRLTILYRQGEPTQSMTPLVGTPFPKDRGVDTTTTSTKGHCNYYTARAIFCHVANKKEVCMLRLEKYIDLSSAEYKCKKAPEEKKKPSFLAALFSFGRSSKEKSNHDILPLPLVLMPISRSLPEIDIAGDINIEDQDLVTIGYLEGRRLPFWATSKFMELRNAKESTSTRTDKGDEKVSKIDTTFTLKTRLSLDTQMVGSVCINGDGKMVGLVCKSIWVDSGFACACAASYRVVGPQLLRRLLKRAQKKCDAELK